VSDISPKSQPAIVGFELSALSAYSAAPGTIEGVSFWPRVAARMIDLVAHIAVTVVAGFLFGIMLLIAAGGHISPLLALKLRQTTLASFVLALLGSIAYQAICEGLHGSSLGKLALSMVVVQEDGSPCRLGSEITRSFAYPIDSLFFGLIGYFAMQKSVQEQRHGDEWAHTVVCKRSKIPPENLRSGGRFVAVLLFAVMADAALGMIGLLLKLMA
jgi:uncharacterized RDD family membrane protein YckC